MDRRSFALPPVRRRPLARPWDAARAPEYRRARFAAPASPVASALVRSAACRVICRGACLSASMAGPDAASTTDPSEGTAAGDACDDVWRRPASPAEPRPPKAAPRCKVGKSSALPSLRNGAGMPKLPGRTLSVDHNRLPRRYAPIASRPSSSQSASSGMPSRYLAVRLLARSRAAVTASTHSAAS